MLGDKEAARKVWEDALKTGVGRYAEAWIAAADFERAQRNIREARGVYRRAHSRRFEEGGQYSVCTAWLRFEREEGR